MRELIEPHSIDLSLWLKDFSRQINISQAYREPTSTEVSDFLVKIANSESTLESYDSASKKQFTMLNHTYGLDSAWGAVVFDRSATPSIVIEVPHIVADAYTEVIGLDLWRRVPGAVLLIAGAHRDAQAELADVPWNPGSMFNKVAGSLIPLPQLQVHGFANSTAPEHDVCLAPGSAGTSQLLFDIADALELAGFRVARVWNGDIAVLTAKGNEQSKQALTAGSTFVHMEINNTVRMSAILRRKLAEAVSTCLLPLI